MVHLTVILSIYSLYCKAYGVRDIAVTQEVVPPMYYKIRSCNDTISQLVCPIVYLGLHSLIRFTNQLCCWCLQGLKNYVYQVLLAKLKFILDQKSCQKNLSPPPPPP